MLPLYGRGRNKEAEGAGEGAEGVSTSAFWCFSVLLFAIGAHQFQ
jgi:hypothetical protein